MASLIYIHVVTQSLFKQGVHFATLLLMSAQTPSLFVKFMLVHLDSLFYSPLIILDSIMYEATGGDCLGGAARRAMFGTPSRVAIPRTGRVEKPHQSIIHRRSRTICVTGVHSEAAGLRLAHIPPRNPSSYVPPALPTPLPRTPSPHQDTAPTQTLAPAATSSRSSP